MIENSNLLSHLSLWVPLDARREKMTRKARQDMVEDMMYQLASVLPPK